MSDITISVRKYSAAYGEHPPRILAYSPSILVRILRIHRVSSRIGKHTLVYSPRILGILAYSRVFAAYPAYPRILAYSSRILAYSRVFSRILAYSSRVSCVFAAYSSAYSRVFAAYLPRILRIRRVFSRIRCVLFAYGAGYMSPHLRYHLFPDRTVVSRGTVATSEVIWAAGAAGGVFGGVETMCTR